MLAARITFTPFLNFLVDEAFKLRRRTLQNNAAQLIYSRLYLRITEARINFFA